MLSGGVRGVCRPRSWAAGGSLCAGRAHVAVLIGLTALGSARFLPAALPAVTLTPESRGLIALKAANKAVEVADFAKALKLYQESLDAFRAGGIEDREGEAILGQGFVYYNLGQLDQAESASQEALRKVAFSEKLWGTAANAHRLLGNVFSDRGDHAGALDEFEKSREMAAAHGSRALAAQVECEIGYVYYSLGDYRTAIARTEKALREGTSLRRQGIQLDAQILLANLYRDLNDYRKALQHFERALDLTRTIDDPYSAAVVYDGLSYLYDALGDCEKAMTISTESLHRAEQTGSSKLLGQVYASAGHEYFVHGDFAKSEEFLTRAATLSREGKDEWNLAWVYQDLSRLRVKQGRFAEAIRAAQEATRIAEGRNDIELTWNSLYLLGNSLRCSGDSRGALRNFAAAIETIESGRAGVQSGSQRSGYMTNKQALYEGMVAVLLEQHREADALRVSEKFRARTFLETLLHPSLTDRADLSSDPGLKEILFPRFASVDEIRRDILGPHDVLIEYVVGEKRVYGFAVTPRVLVAKDMCDAQELGHMVSRYLDFVSREDGEFSGREGGRRLYELLLAPLLEGISAPFDRMIISPDSVLHLLPFETLVTDDGKYLIERNTVTYVSSATILQKLKERRISLDHLRLIAVADPEGMAAEGGHAKLPYSLREIREISDCFSGQRILLSGTDATKTKFFSLDLSRPTVFHFASHAVIDDSDTLRSRIMLHAQGDDGELSFNDIIGKKWASPLAVLSACGSGRGRLLNGEGLDGFSRSFFYSGVNCLIMTLWNVEDETSFLLMRDFYDELARGATIDEGLRRAKLKRLSEHPSHWAGFVCSGLSDQPIFVSRGARREAGSWGWLPVLLAVCLLAAGTVALLIRRRVASPG